MNLSPSVQNYISIGRVLHYLWSQRGLGTSILFCLGYCVCTPGWYQNGENIRSSQQTDKQLSLHLGYDLTVEKLWTLGLPFGKTETSWASAGQTTDSDDCIDVFQKLNFHLC